MESKKAAKVFCDSLNEWVVIRVLSPQRTRELLKDIHDISSKKAYYDLVITFCVRGYLDRISKKIVSDQSLSAISDIINEELYKLCVKINSSLDINEVRIDMGPSEEIALITSSPEPEPEVSAVLDLEDRLAQEIVGQQDAIERVARIVKRAEAGLKHPDKPVGSFSFVGKTGVGKTEFAKALSRCLYGNVDNLIRIDCSEYAMSHEYAKLIGAPPGYIGHGDGGMLTEAMKKKAKAVVLFDEIEKAHRKVHNILLQIMDDGRVTDNKGEHIRFGDSVIIMTSNVGVDSLDSIENSIGFSKTFVDHGIRKRETVKSFEKYFPPEFVNRIDDIIVFKDLSIEDKCQIAEKILGEIQIRSVSRGFYLDFSESVPEFIVEIGDNSKYGARPIRRTIERQIESPLSDKILRDEITPESRIFIDVKKGKLKFYHA